MTTATATAAPIKRGFVRMFISPMKKVPGVCFYAAFVCGGAPVLATAVMPSPGIGLTATAGLARLNVAVATVPRRSLPSHGLLSCASLNEETEACAIAPAAPPARPAVPSRPATPAQIAVGLKFPLARLPITDVARLPTV